MRASLRVLLVGLAISVAAGMALSQSGTVVASEWVVIDGQRWALYKVIRGGKEEHLFRGPGARC